MLTFVVDQARAFVSFAIIMAIVLPIAVFALLGGLQPYANRLMAAKVALGIALASTLFACVDIGLTGNFYGLGTHVDKWLMNPWWSLATALLSAAAFSCTVSVLCSWPVAGSASSAAGSSSPTSAQQTPPPWLPAKRFPAANGLAIATTNAVLTLLCLLLAFFTLQLTDAPYSFGPYGYSNSNAFRFGTATTWVLTCAAWPLSVLAMVPMSPLKTSTALLAVGIL